MFIVTHADFVSEEPATAETLNLIPLAAGDLVFNVLLEVRTPAAGATVVTGVVGGSLIAALTDTVNLLADGDRYYTTKATAAPLLAIGAAHLVFILAPDVQEGSLETAADLTAGEFWVWTNISRKAERNLQA